MSDTTEISNDYITPLGVDVDPKNTYNLATRGYVWNAISSITGDFSKLTHVNHVEYTGNNVNVSCISGNTYDGEVNQINCDLSVVIESEKGHRLLTDKDYDAISDGISAINSVISEQATPDNKLVDRDFVLSEIHKESSNFRGNWVIWNEVPEDTSLYPSDCYGNRTPNNNDYIIIKDASALTYTQKVDISIVGCVLAEPIDLVGLHNGDIISQKDYTQIILHPEITEVLLYRSGTWRFVYVGEWSDKGKDGWCAEYKIENTAFTDNQWDAINSGINSDILSDITSTSGNWDSVYNSVFATSGKWDSMLASANAYADANYNELTEIIANNTLTISQNINNILTNTSDIRRLEDRVNTSNNKLNSVYTTVDSNSGDWGSVYNSVFATSGKWNNTNTTVSANSGDWDSVYNSVFATSGKWGSVYNSVFATSGKWNNTNTTVSANSGKWNNTNTTVSANSGKWNNTTTTVSANSGDWDSVYNSVFATSGKWDSMLASANAYADANYNELTEIIANNTLTISQNINNILTNTSDIRRLEDDINSVNLQIGNMYTTIDNISGICNNTTTTVASNSGNWNTAYITITSNIGKLNTTYTTVTANTGKWNNTNTTVSANSGKWDDTATIVDTNIDKWDNARTYSIVSSIIDGEDVAITDRAINHVDLTDKTEGIYAMVFPDQSVINGITYARDFIIHISFGSTALSISFPYIGTEFYVEEGGVTPLEITYETNCEYLLSFTEISHNKFLCSVKKLGTVQSL